jgi:hypothetical protein|tara:strand:+ start:880 stop:1161 length:282 start_codon:yes stop_codon:yes gene_type:complete
MDKEESIERSDILSGSFEDKEHLIKSLRKYVYDNREWTTSGWNKAIDTQMKSQQRDLKFYFDQYDMMIECSNKRFKKFLRRMAKKYPDGDGVI